MDECLHQVGKQLNTHKIVNIRFQTEGFQNNFKEVYYNYYNCRYAYICL